LKEGEGEKSKNYSNKSASNKKKVEENSIAVLNNCN
jgi:hypothetical protein